MKERFHRSTESWLGGLYTGLDPLPHLSRTVPAYYQDVVDACCARDPQVRLSCKDLLSIFPPVTNDGEQGLDSTNLKCVEEEVVQNIGSSLFAAVKVENKLLRWTIGALSIKTQTSTYAHVASMMEDIVGIRHIY